MALVVFAPNWIGDAVMATPALRAIAAGFGAESLTVVGRPALRDLYDGLGWFRSFIPFDPRSSDHNLRTTALIRNLRAQTIDIAILLTHSWRTAYIAWRAGARRRVGFKRGGRTLLLSDGPLPWRHNGRFVPHPVIDDYLALSYYLGCPRPPIRLELATTPAGEAAADLVWRGAFAAADRPIVCLNPGAAFGPAKLWPEEYHALLARRLATREGCGVLILCGPSERAIAARIVAAANHPAVRSLADEQVSLGLTKACLRRSRLLVTSDSGPRHIAIAMGVPTLTLYGPTDPAWTRTYSEGDEGLRLSLECSPCQARVCPLGHQRCLRDMRPDVVGDAAVALLRRPRVPAREEAA